MDFISDIISHAKEERVKVTSHAQQEMIEDSYTIDDVLFALQKSIVLENYPDHKRGSCCLLLGYTQTNRPIHIVCTTSLELLILITVYEPIPPKWITPFKRGNYE